MRHKHRYWFVSRHIFTMQRMHVCNAQWESTASTQVFEIFIFWILSDTANPCLIPIPHIIWIFDWHTTINSQCYKLHCGQFFRDHFGTYTNTWHTPQLLVDCASVNQLPDRTLLINKTHRRKMLASLPHMSHRHGLLWQ